MLVCRCSHGPMYWIVTISLQNNNISIVLVNGTILRAMRREENISLEHLLYIFLFYVLDEEKFTYHKRCSVRWLIMYVHACLVRLRTLQNQIKIDYSNFPIKLKLIIRIGKKLLVHW